MQIFLIRQQNLTCLFSTKLICMCVCACVCVCVCACVYINGCCLSGWTELNPPSITQIACSLSAAMAAASAASSLSHLSSQSVMNINLQRTDFGSLHSSAASKLLNFKPKRSRFRFSSPKTFVLSFKKLTQCSVLLVSFCNFAVFSVFLFATKYLTTWEMKTRKHEDSSSFFWFALSMILYCRDYWMYSFCCGIQMSIN